MGIKINNPQNSIIVEGLWGTGKTCFSLNYSNLYNYVFMPEPLHTDADKLEFENKIDIDQWYIRNHKSREIFFDENKPIIMERSIFSCFAFLYALGKPLPDDSYIYSLKKIIESKKVLVVYFRANDLPFSYDKKDQYKKYSDDIEKILFNNEIRKRYDEWFTNVLPRKYGIAPLVLDIIQVNKRFSVEDLVNQTRLSLIHNRIGQVNIVCFKKPLITEDYLKILILKRNQKKGGFWQTITGGINVGEDPFLTAKRELCEETGLNKNNVEIFWTNLSYSFVGNDGYPLYEYVFGCEIKNFTNIKISDEHEKLNWLSPDEATQNVFYENNKIAIETVVKKIR